MSGTRTSARDGPETGFAEITQRATIYKDHSLLYILRNPDSQHISQIMGSWKSGAGFVAVLIIFYKVIVATISPVTPRREKSSKKEL